MEDEVEDEVVEEDEEELELAVEVLDEELVLDEEETETLGLMASAITPKSLPWVVPKESFANESALDTTWY